MATKQERQEKRFQKYFGMSKQEWEQGARALNSQWSHNNKGLPNRFQITDMQDNGYAHRFDKEFVSLDLSNDCFNRDNENGFPMFLAIWYEKFANFTGSLFKWDDKMLEDLGIHNKYDLERLLLEAGSMAICKIDGNYWLFNYDTIEEDVYHQPTKIKVKNANDTFNDKELTDDEFVIIKGNQNGWNKIVENGTYFTMAWKLGCQINDEISRGQDHYGLLQGNDIELKGAQLADVINEFTKSDETVLTLLPKNAMSGQEGNPDVDLGELFENFQKSLIKFEYKERIDLLTQMFQDWLGEGLKYLGYSVNMNMMKKERQITGEIDIQQEIPTSQKTMMFELREAGVKEANKKFGTKWTFEFNPRVASDAFQSPKDNGEVQDEKGEE